MTHARPHPNPFPHPDMKPLALLLSALVLAAVALPALAGPGHDHGDSAPVATGPALPRFAASSELFELVGVLEGQRLTLYLDRAPDNAPVTGAQIELEIAGAKFKATPRDDVYEIQLAAAPAPGVLPVTATVTAGQDIDLLAGDLDLHADEHGHEAAHGHGWPAYAGWAAGAVAALVALALVGRRIVAARHARTGAAA